MLLALVNGDSIVLYSEMLWSDVTKLHVIYNKIDKSSYGEEVLLLFAILAISAILYSSSSSFLLTTGHRLKTEIIHTPLYT